ncbi:MAG: PilZ domain-containing protein [candidate division NC10 bacterium]
MTKAHHRRVTRRDLQKRKPPRFRTSGITSAITTLQEAEVLDLSLSGALVEHQDVLQLASPCFLQLMANGERLTIQCRVVHSRVSHSGADGALYCQTGLEFLDLSRGAQQSLGAFIRSYGAAEG